MANSTRITSIGTLLTWSIDAPCFPRGRSGSAYRLEYTLDGDVGSVDYTVTDPTVAFVFTSPSGDVTTETYTR